MVEIDPRYAAPWTDCADLVRRELDAYVAALPDGSLPTRCVPWTVADVTKHLAATFYRFNEMLRRGRAEQFAPPFAPEELAAENQRAIDGFPPGLDPARALCEEATRFTAMATDPAEPIPHQRGPIPVGLQMRWGLAELAIHHDDVAAAAGSAYQPAADVVEQIVPAWTALGHGAPDGKAWAWILARAGR